MIGVAFYMKKAARHLELFYTKMVHVTSLAHSIYIVGKEFCSQFNIIDYLVANVK